MIGYQVAARAMRDTMFLSNFDFARLPWMVAGASVFAVAFALLATRAMSRYGPSHVIPAGFAVSAVFTLGEWWLATRRADVAAILIYLHVAAVGPALISGFWSILTERMDPRSAKRRIGLIAGFGTLGGLLGGVVAERITVWNGVAATLPALAVMHGGCAAMLFRIRRVAPTIMSGVSDGPRVSAGQAARRLASTPYLRNLALLILGTSVSAALLDFVFKGQVSAATRPGADLMRVFTVFYTGVALCTFAIQALATRVTLERGGLTRAIGALPASVVVSGIAAAVVPGPWSVGIARGLEAILRGSLFRAGYELLYTPIPAAEKRATKTLVDVGCDRFGEAIGAVLTLGVLAVTPRGAPLALIAIAVFCALAMFAVVSRLQRGYVMSLEAGLRAGSLTLASLEVQDATTRATLESTFSTLDLTGLHALRPTAEHPLATSSLPDDAITRSMRDLRSGDVARVRAVLAGPSELDATLVPQAIRLLAREETARDAMHALRQIAPAHTGQLVDALIDPSTDFAVRRRIPRLLAGCPGVRVLDGLTQGLTDDRFEVRVRCARALARVLKREPGLPLDHERIFDAIQREATAGRAVWDAQKVLDHIDDRAGEDDYDELLRERAGLSLEHVFVMLSLVLPPEPLRIAYRGLHVGDPHLRGTALEYLENVLPPAVRVVLWPYLDTDGRSGLAPRRHTHERSEVLQTLLSSHRTIEIELEALRKRSRGEGRIEGS